MAKLNYLLRYLLIIKKLAKTGEATFKEINEFLGRESEKLDMPMSISSRTFQRDLEDIRTLFGIDIQYDAAKRTYSQTEDSYLNVHNQRLLEAVELAHALNFAGNVSPYIIPENRRASGSEEMLPLLQAIRNHKLVEFKYSSYWGRKETSRITEPLALKEFKGRWYLVATDRKDNRIKTFGLDRMQDLTVTDRHFKPDLSIDQAQLFEHCFGVTNNEGEEPEQIELSFDPEQGQYIKSYPIHASQQILIDNEEEVQIQLYLNVTHELIMELLSYADTFEVIKPYSLRERLAKTYAKALSRLRCNQEINYAGTHRKNNYLDNYYSDTPQKDLDVIQGLIKTDFKEIDILIIHGKPGNGCTFLLDSIANYYSDNKKKIAFINSHNFYQHFKSRTNDFATYLETCSFLFLDDLHILFSELYSPTRMWLMVLMEEFINKGGKVCVTCNDSYPSEKIVEYLQPYQVTTATTNDRTLETMIRIGKELDHQGWKSKYIVERYSEMIYMPGMSVREYETRILLICGREYLQQA